MQQAKILIACRILLFLMPVRIAATPTTVGINIKDMLVAKTADRQTQLKNIHIPLLTFSCAK